MEKIIKRGDQLFQCSVTYITGKGYYAFVFPAVLSKYDGNVQIEITGGINAKVLSASRKSAKLEKEAISLAESYYEHLIDNLISKRINK